MPIILSPAVAAPSDLARLVSLAISGEELAVEATTGTETHDLSGIAEGDTVDLVSDWIREPVTRSGGELAVVVYFPITGTAPEAARYPAAIAWEDGEVDLPAVEVLPDPEPVEEPED